MKIIPFSVNGYVNLLQHSNSFVIVFTFFQCLSIWYIFINIRGKIMMYNRQLLLLIEEGGGF